MSDKRTHSDYLQKAAMYDLLAQYYKYTNPQYYMHFYLKHIKCINKAIEIMQNNTRAKLNDSTVRFLHTSFDSPNIDIYMNGQKVIKDLPFKNVSTNLMLKSGKYHIDIYPAGNMVNSVLNKTITIEPGKSYTLSTIDEVRRMRLLVFENQPTVPENEAKVRFIHLSPHTPAIDIAVKERDVVFPNVVYKQSTDYLGLTPMTVDLEIREAGSKTVLLPLPKMQFEPNESYTVVLVGLKNEKQELQIVSMMD